MEKTLQIHLAEQREAIAREIEAIEEVPQDADRLLAECAALVRGHK